MKARTGRVVILGTWVMVLGVSGCGDRFMDPAQIGRFRVTPQVNVILDSLGVAEEVPVAWESGEEPRPADIVPSEHNYTLGPGDVLQISIFELFAQGQMVTQEYVVNETGTISIPEVGTVTASGLTEPELEDQIKDILTPDILRNPSVSVMLLSSQRRTCSVIGDGVSAPGRQIIPRNDYRLTDALATARGPHQFNVSYVYVSRPETNPRVVPEEATSRHLRKAVPLSNPRLQRQNRQQGNELDTPLEMLGPQPTASEEQVSRVSGPHLSYRERRLVQPFNRERQMLGMDTPTMQRLWAESEKVLGRPVRPTPYRSFSNVIASAEFDQDRTPRDISPPPPNQWRVRDPGDQLAAANDTADAQPAGEIEWIFENGRWIPIQRQGGTQPSVPVPQQSRRPVQVPETQTPTRQQPTQPAPTRQQPTQPPEAAPEGTGGLEWIFENGRWIPVPVHSGTEQIQPQAPFKEDHEVLPLDTSLPPQERQWRQAVKSRLIKIPTDRLLAGDPRYNIIVKPGDTIHVPVDIVGEFYITGNVNRSGTIPLTGRPMTLKMAIAAAGGLGPLAYPRKCEVIRRLDNRREEIVMVDLDKIARGEQPDFFIKPHDLINVGTHFSSRWRMVLRNAFRAAYGFGFVYDRNFADADYGKGWPHWL